MPKSRKRKISKMNKDIGANHNGKRLTKQDIINKQQAYNEKLEEYEEMSLFKLESLKAQGTVKGTYADALDDAIKEKEEKQKAAS